MKRTYDEDDEENDHGNDDTGDEVGEQGSAKKEVVQEFPPYDATQEELPASPVFLPEFTDLVNAKAELIGLLEGPIKGSTYRNGALIGLLEEVNRRMAQGSPEQVTIALVGQMGSGKSSLINSLLSVGTIARQGDKGNSCTWVVSEFTYLLPNQSKPFAAEVHFFSQEECHAIIKAHFARYHRASSKAGDDETESKDHEQEIEDYDIRREAMESFRALFADHTEFATRRAATDFLSTARSDDDAVIVKKLCRWSDELINRLLGGDTRLRKEANTTQTLLRDLAPFLYTLPEQEINIVSPWPLVNYVKFGLENRLLKNNVSLVDLPGLDDTNKTRAKNAGNHLRRCTHQMIVAEIGRTGDKQFIRQKLYQAQWRLGSGRAILVLTNSDIIDDENDVEGSDQDMQIVKDYLSEMKNLARKKTVQLGRMKAAKTEEMEMQFNLRRHELQTQFQDTKAKYNEFCIRLRSKDVIAKMKELYRQLTKDSSNLPVFCVGNLAYKRHVGGYATDDRDAPTLSVSETMIPSLRQHILLTPAEGKLNEMRHQLTTQIPVLINLFNLFGSKTHMARRHEIEQYVLEPQADVVKFLDTVFTSAKNDVESHILAPLRAAEGEWCDEAQAKCEEWADMYTTQMHLDFLKKDGVKKIGKGKTAKEISWNSQLLSIRLVETRKCFVKFRDSSFKLVEKRVISEINTMVKHMIDQIKDDDQVELMALKPFLVYLDMERANIIGCVQGPVRNMRKDLGTVFIKNITECNDNSIVQGMARIYDDARKIKGGPKGPKKRQIHFERDVCRMGTGVWMTAHDTLKDDLEKLFDNYSAQFKFSLQNFFIHIHNQFNMMCANEELPKQEKIAEAAIREQLIGNIALAQDMLTKEMMPAFNECVKNENNPDIDPALQ